MPITTNPLISELSSFRDRFTELLAAITSGPAILRYIMSPSTPATRRDVHDELAKLEQSYLVTVPRLVETLTHKMEHLDAVLIPWSPDQRHAVSQAWQQQADHTKTAIHKLRYMFELGGPLADWRAIARELEVSASPFREFARNVDGWLRNLHLGRRADGTPANAAGGIGTKAPPPPSPKTTPPTVEEDSKVLTPEQKKQLREEIERRRHLPFAEQLKLTMHEYEAMSELFRRTHPAPKPPKPGEDKPADVDLPPDDYETNDDGVIKKDHWGRPIKKVHIPTTPEEFVRQEEAGDRRFEDAQQRWVRKVINKLDTMSKFTRLNKLLETDEPFGIFLSSIVATKYKFGSLALKAIHKAKGVIGKTSGGYLIMRNLPVLGVTHQDDPQLALKFLQESTSRILDKQRRWARFWFICSVPLYRGGHDYYLLWPKSLVDDVHKGYFVQWQFNLTDTGNADAGTQA